LKSFTVFIGFGFDGGQSLTVFGFYFLPAQIIGGVFYRKKQRHRAAIIYLSVAGRTFRSGNRWSTAARLTSTFSDRRNRAASGGS
jgi:hypothetical protein